MALSCDLDTILLFQPQEEIMSLEHFFLPKKNKNKKNTWQFLSVITFHVRAFRATDANGLFFAFLGPSLPLLVVVASNQ